jgi:hypothetical protein
MVNTFFKLDELTMLCSTANTIIFLATVILIEFLRMNHRGISIPGGIVHLARIFRSPGYNPQWFGKVS